MWNDKETDIDLLGHEKIAATILSIIQDQHLRPLTIGIYGDWGVGKSSVLSLLQSQAKATAAAKVYNHHCIMFNGWLFQGYEDAKTALMETVVSEIAELQTLTAEGKKLAKSIFKRINWLKVAKLAIGTGITMATGLPATGIIGGLIDKVKEGVKTDEEEKYLNDKEEDEETVTKQIRAFRSEFAKLIKESKVDHVIIMIDDLDRCLPKTVIEILEAIRLLLFVEGTTFVISGDERMIEYAVREHFPNLPLEYKEYTSNYLEKLVQVPLRMPALTSLQTGNYIKLLMIQFYLKGDKAKMEAVLSAYEGKKARPYDNLVLSYEIVTEALGETNEELAQAIAVADQITPTLAAHLRGNPRNIKRFLNTLFLRLRIAKIYGLETEVQLSKLAKLMLLERFQPAFYDNIIDEVSMDPNGLSKSIAEAETGAAAASGTDSEDSIASSVITGWAKVLPQIGARDLRPYIFISREKAISFAANDGLSDAALQVYEKLNSGSDMAVKAAEKPLMALSPSDRSLIFDKLVLESRSVEDFSSLHKSFKGMLRIIQKDPSFEERLLSRIEIIPAEKLGTWCVSELSGLHTDIGKQKFKALLGKWQSQSANTRLKTLAQQTLSRQ